MFSAICWSAGRETAGTAANDHPRDSSRTREWYCFNFAEFYGDVALRCFRDGSLGLNLMAFLYIELPLLLNYSISIPTVFDISRFYCITVAIALRQQIISQTVVHWLHYQFGFQLTGFATDMPICE